MKARFASIQILENNGNIGSGLGEIFPKIGIGNADERQFAPPVARRGAELIAALGGKLPPHNHSVQSMTLSTRELRREAAIAVRNIPLTPLPRHCAQEPLMCGR